ncbi:MAG TPA: quinone oxidoreductase, partial [Candidatus Polarisedimenticolaceae bacterium]|nr:quinone oxidoreductase [Candidatus Polarisedimenticolaceae bacterium]
GPEVLRYEQVELPAPAPGEARIRHTAIGLNFIDTYHRSGLYPLPSLPAVLGREAAGVIEAVGPGVEGFQVGDRVAYPMSAGAYASERNIDAAEIVRLPDAIDDRQAAAMMLKGLTAHYLLRRTYRVREGETILVHAAAGGVGSIACQWAKHLGATVIGTVGSEEKAQLARRYGCDHVIIYTAEDFVTRVREITAGNGVPVVYDSVGRATFDRSLDCLSPCGLLVSFGQSSGPVPPFIIGTLASKGSLYLTRPTLATHIAARDDLVRGAEELFRLVSQGAVRIEVRQTFALADAERAHRHLESRRTSGSTVLLP